MDFLLDTHTYLWFVSGDNQLPLSVSTKIKNLNQPCCISIASFWEITIKQQIGKLNLDMPLEELFEFAVRNQIEVLDITLDHLLVLSSLDSFHNDPFDRLIIAQAISEDYTVLTIDGIFEKYPVKQQWK